MDRKREKFYVTRMPNMEQMVNGDAINFAASRGSVSEDWRVIAHLAMRQKNGIFALPRYRLASILPGQNTWICYSSCWKYRYYCQFSRKSDKLDWNGQTWQTTSSLLVNPKLVFSSLKVNSSVSTLYTIRENPQRRISLSFRGNKLDFSFLIIARILRGTRLE